ncbi:MAG: histidine kinase [Lentimicrobium sp.]|nr:histidine kinase [Lentimicrobium sp.]
MSKSLVSILIMVFAYGWLHAQQPVFRHYSVDEGLPSSEVYQVIQDKKGYIWIATNMGVSRFDGRTFKNYDVQDGLPENTVFEVYEDETGRIWFISFPFQLSFFRNDSIIPYKYNSVLRMLAGRGAVPVKKSFMADKEDNVIFSLLRGGIIYELNSKGELNKLTNLANSGLAALIMDKADHLFVAQLGGQDESNKILINTTLYSKYVNIKKSEKYSHVHLMASKINDGTVLFTLNEFLHIVKPDGSYSAYNLKERIFWLSGSDDGSIWIGKEISGIEKYQLNSIEKGPVIKYLSKLSVSSSYIDNSGGTWFTTLEDGLYYLPSGALKSINTSDGLSVDNIKSIDNFKDAIYMGLSDGKLFKYDHNSVSELIIPESIPKSINVIKNQDDELLWLATDDYLYSYNGDKFNYYMNNFYFNKRNHSASNSRYIFNIKDIFPTKNRIYLGEAKGLSILEGGMITYNSSFTDEIDIRIESIEMMKDSTILIGAFNGLWKFADDRFEYLGYEIPLLKQRITDIIITDKKSDIILGTKGSGLIYKYGDSIIQITRNDGLSSNSISCLLHEGNNLWVGTNNGLNLININELSNNPKIIHFKKEHGLISNEINKISSNQNYIYIATNKGLTIIDKSMYMLENTRPPIYINNVKIMKRDTAILDSYQLHHNQNFITISFIGISFRDGGNLLYKYRLKGLSNEWISTNNLEVEYAFLPPGSYQFEVIAINSEGNASIEPAVLSFKISHPYWQTWWFIALVILLALASVLAFYYYRLKIVKKEHALQNDINWYRQQALTRQMDPHFVFNTLNSIQSYIIKNDRLSSSQYLSKFARLMRLILNNSQKQAIPLSDEIAALNLYMELESLRFQQKFEFSIITDHSVDVDSCYIPAFLIQPFVENAIWHGIMGLKIQGIIRISFSRERDQLICQVEDNGIGRTQSMEMKPENEKQKKSLGISLVETRLNLLNYFYSVNMKIVFTDLFNEDNSPAGTKVTINLPIIN